MSFFGSLGSGLLSLLTGGLSNMIGSGNLGSLLSAGGDSVANANPASGISNLTAKYTGERLTDAEREANAWTASREDLYWDKQMEAENTRYQRSVADMQAAGLNPALMMSGGSQPAASAPSLNPEGSVSPGGESLNLGSLLSLALQSKLIPAQIGNLEADAALKNASASNLVEQERGARIVNDFNERTAALREESIRAENALKHANYRQVYKQMDVMETEMTRNIEQAHTEQEKQNYMQAEAFLKKIEAWQIAELLPYRKELLSAQSEQERSLAALHAVNKMYQQGLIDDGYIDALVDKLNNESFEAECRAHGLEADNVKKQLAAALRNGTLPEGFRIGIPFLDKRIGELLGGAIVFLDSLNPVAGLINF